MREELLAVIEKNSRIDLKELAVILGVEEIDVVNEMAQLESEGVICGYHTMINWEKTSLEKVGALIEVKVTPQRGQGFDSMAERIYKYPEVDAVYLLSGGYDLLIIIDAYKQSAALRIGKAANPLQVLVVPRLLKFNVLCFLRH